MSNANAGRATKSTSDGGWRPGSRKCVALLALLAALTKSVENKGVTRLVQGCQRLPLAALKGSLSLSRLSRDRRARRDEKNGHTPCTCCTSCEKHRGFAGGARGADCHPPLAPLGTKSSCPLSEKGVTGYSTARLIAADTYEFANVWAVTRRSFRIGEISPF